MVARRQAGGTGDERRRIFQRHLVIFIVVNGAVLGLDYMTGPGMQFWHWLGFFWGVLFLIHLGGLLSRGFTPIELFLPPRKHAPLDEDAPPLAYELVKARQLRDGIARAAGSVREREPGLVDAASAASDELEAAVAEIVSAARSSGAVSDDETGASIESELREALNVLDALHAGLIRAAVGDEPLEQAVPIDAARERLDRLKSLLARLEGERS